jgi:aspartyl-tRNA(Asn)/glutamyl-tRNA(Gln) amidotransferase subunit B
MKYRPIIGMEVHVELKTKSKMFCGCENNPDEPAPNTHICEICVGHPGTLPVPNKQAVIWTAKIGRALGCQIRELSKFDRKHYFYPDLPKGYQISQYDQPIAEKGRIDLDFLLETNHRDRASIGITRVHLEEDTAKLQHNESGVTLVDFNRAGTPLVEIVSDPNFESAAEAKKYCQELRLLFRALGVSDADMEKGHMRCEANVSVQEVDSFDIVEGGVQPRAGKTLNPKVELKNLNSFRAVEKAITAEIKRQTEMIEKGETWAQQTRGWNENAGETVMQRIKENADDYRYFPEPDIPPFHPLEIAKDIRLPELPQAQRQRFHEEFGFSYSDALMLTSSRAWSGFAEHVMSELIDWLHSLPDVKGGSDTIREKKKQKIARLAGGWLTTKLMGQLGSAGKTIEDVSFSPENFAELISLIYTSKVNAANAQKILIIMVASERDHDPSHILEEKGWGQVEDEGVIEKIVDHVIAQHTTQVQQYKDGKEAVLKFLIGMAMKASEGTLEPKGVEEMLKKKLS